MNIVDLNEKNFNSIVSQNGIVMVYCWAEWCAACRKFTPVFEKTAGRRQDHTFAKLNTAAENGLVSELNIEHVPTLLIFREGILVFQQPGNYDEEKLENILDQAANLDMDAVRKHFEEEKMKQTETN
jgi:thioredoxin 1